MLTIRNKIMITKEEFYELDAIRRAIKDNPASVHPDQMERFTELFVKSIKEKNYDVPLQQLSTTY